MDYLPIEQYGVIGDLATVALVGQNGSIDFLSLPRFDSPTVFAALLDHGRGGRFRLAPLLENLRHKQLYLPDTNILITRFLSADGVAEIIDFMPVRAPGSRPRLLRQARVVRGEVKFRMLCQPRFDYARAPHAAARERGCVTFTARGAGGASLRLHHARPVEIRDGDAVATFVLHPGETAEFCLEGGEGREGRPDPACPEEMRAAFEETMKFWRAWVRRSRYAGRWREIVNRSALTLKLLTSHEHGSVVAAATTSLPEMVGGTRNWDYRYTWLRDSTFALYALMRLGYTTEAEAFMGWIEKRCGEMDGGETLQIMYGVDGRHDLSEETLDHLEGYRGSRPVRIGNAAFSQLQLDIYGELMDTVYLYNKYGQRISNRLWTDLTRLVDWVGENWERPDEGLWEIRDRPREFLHSRLMCWVAIDRAVRLALKSSLPAPLDRWIRARDGIYRDIIGNFWNPRLESFVQHKGGSSTDASSLLIPLMKFLGPTDPIWISTLRRIERELVEESLVHRYREADGLAGQEGTFSMCGFWYVECLARAGEVDRARLLFEKMLGFANHLGLYAEEIGPSGEHLGNFPQAFTHLGLISAAWNLDKALDRAAGR